MTDQLSQPDAGAPEPAGEAPPMRGDTAMAVEFLVKYSAKEVVSLSAIGATGVGLEYQCFHPDNADDIERMHAWIDARQGVSNLYFTVNPLIRVTKTKPTKLDIRGAKWLHADIDPRVGEDIDSEKERNLKKLQSYKNVPTVIIDSGGGLQAFWKLDSEYETVGVHDKILRIEGKNRRIALDFEADNCHNIDRIMRVPGTINVPNATKIKKGRKTCLAKLLTFDSERTYSLEQFEAIGDTLAAASASITPLFKIEKGILLESIPKLTEELRFIALHGADSTNKDRWKSRSEMVHYWVIQSLFEGVKFEDIVGVLLNSRYAISSSILEKGRRAQEYAQRQVQRAQMQAGKMDKPVIEYKGSELSAIITAAERAMVDAGIEVFQTHNVLVRIVDNGTDSPKMMEVKPHWILEKFVDCAKWLKRTGKDLKAFEPKLEVAHHYLARVGEWNVPNLKAITFTPTLREDFSLLNESGYDQRSGLIYNPGLVQFPPIPERPSRAEAVEALNQLIEPFIYFPFVPDNEADDWEPVHEEGRNASSSRSVVLSALITSIIRPALPTAPLHGIDAPEKGSGKSIIADCVGLLATGHLPAMMTMSYNDDEDRKRFFATLLEGSRVIVLDNIDKMIKSDALCTILTQTAWQERILGQSKTSTVSTNALFLATGNNITFGDDMTRRVCVCRLDSRLERPFERSFAFDPRQLVRDFRPTLVAAALKVILAYVHAGRPLQGKIRAMGSFEQYSIVREALMWLDQPDPINHQRVTLDDPLRGAAMEVMSAWWSIYRESDVRLSSFVAGLQDGELGEDQSRLRDLLGSNGKVTSQRVAKWFKDRENKIYNGRMFKRIHDKDGTIIKLKWDDADSMPAEEEVRM